MESKLYYIIMIKPGYEHIGSDR